MGRVNKADEPERQRACRARSAPRPLGTCSTIMIGPSVRRAGSSSADEITAGSGRREECGGGSIKFPPSNGGSSEHQSLAPGLAAAPLISFERLDQGLQRALV
jgi:hypothetical protein